MHFIEEPAFNAFVLFDKVYQGKICFMNLKMQVVDKTITSPFMPGGNKKVTHICVAFLLPPGMKGLEQG